MTEKPSEEELERAARIRRLRMGGATGETYRRRQQRQPDAATQSPDDAESADVESGDTESAEAQASDPEAAEEVGDDLEALLPEDAPPDLTIEPIFVREPLRRKLNRVSEQLHLRYGFEYKSELDPERHIRPLALYLGIRVLADADVSELQPILDRVDMLESPD